ncbi:MAG: ornithine carbamoyltransferase [Candidatus Woesearchaeota archaeon]
MKHLISLKDLSKKEILGLVDSASKIKKTPKKYSSELKGKTLLMLFAKPSLRTRLSFEVAMLKLGGHAIFYDIANSPLGKKESIKDGAEVISRFCDAVMARLFEHKDIVELAKYSDIPVINGLTNQMHPCQILGDFLTIKEKVGRLNKLKICYIGDGNNNVTHSLIIGCGKLGIDIVVCCPNKKEFLPDKKVIGNLRYKYEKDPKKAVKNCQILYSDSWMSYHIPEPQKKKRVAILKPYQVNKRLFDVNKKVLFMHCLPAGRGYEVTDDVIDGKRSIVYLQAENRMWSEMGILLKLLK